MRHMTINKDFEIYLERTRYLLNTDDLLEEILEDQYRFMPTFQTSQIGQEISRNEIGQEIGQNEIGLEITF